MRKGRPPAHMTVSELEVAQLRVLWDAGVPYRSIQSKMGWGKQKIRRIAEYYSFPKRRDPLACRETIAQNVLTEPKSNQRVQHFQKEYTQLSAEQLRKEEFQQQMQTTDTLQRLAWEVIEVMGTTREEIAAFDGPDELLKKTQILKGANELLHKTMDRRRRMVCLDEKSPIEGPSELFGIDYEAAAREAGLKLG